MLCIVYVQSLVYRVTRYILYVYRISIKYVLQFSELPFLFQHSTATPSATSTSGLEPSKPQHLASPTGEMLRQAAKQAIQRLQNAESRWRKQ